MMTLKELLNELKKAEESGEYFLISSLLTSVLENKNLTSEDKITYLLQKVNTLLYIGEIFLIFIFFKKGAYSDALAICEGQTTSITFNNPNPDIIALKFKCMQAEALYGKNKIWDGYIELLRTQSYAL